jgi:hypothetical protein
MLSRQAGKAQVADAQGKILANSAVSIQFTVVSESGT